MLASFSCWISWVRSEPPLKSGLSKLQSWHQNFSCLVCPNEHFYTRCLLSARTSHGTTFAPRLSSLRVNTPLSFTNYAAFYKLKYVCKSCFVQPDKKLFHCQFCLLSCKVDANQEINDL